jgi:polyamine oxidase
MAIYADSERGRYPVWQSLDHPNFFPGSGIVFVTVTVGDPIQHFWAYKR